MKPDDFVELYESLRGARAANQILDAEASAAQKDYPKALQLLQNARLGYFKSHQRQLREDATNNRPLQIKQEKIEGILRRFDSLIALLEAAVEKFPTPLRHPDLPSPFDESYQAAKTPDGQLDWIYRTFAVSAVKESSSVEAGALYFMASEHETRFVMLDEDFPDDATIPMRAVDTGQRLKPFTRSAFLALGRRGWLIRLRKKQPAEPESGDLLAATPGGAAPGLPDFDVAERDKVLDIGAFTQLLDSAIRTGLLPEAEQIARIRDREFRLGKFLKAQLAMEGLQAKFSAAAASKQAEMRREDAAIAAGRIRMSPKDLQAKRVRDQRLTQSIERARSRFSRVLDGLRILSRTLSS